MRNWNKYINKNKYSECQLITSLNAYYYLTGKQYCKPDSQKYEDLVDLVCARVGAAIDIEKVNKILGIEIIWEGINLLHFGDNIPLPMEFSAWAKGYGFHSTLIVDYNKKCNAFRITNFGKKTSEDGWIFAEDLYKYEHFCFERDYETYQLYGLKGDKKNDAIKKEWKKDRNEWFKTYRRKYINKCKKLGIK